MLRARDLRSCREQSSHRTKHSRSDWRRLGPDRIPAVTVWILWMYNTILSIPGHSASHELVGFRSRGENSSTTARIFCLCLRKRSIYHVEPFSATHNQKYTILHSTHPNSTSSVPPTPSRLFISTREASPWLYITACSPARLTVVDPSRTPGPRISPPYATQPPCR